MFALLHGADGAGFVEVALVVCVESTEGILEAKDGALVELGILPGAREIQFRIEQAWWGSEVGGISYLCSLIIFMAIMCRLWEEERVSKVSLWPIFVGVCSIQLRCLRVRGL